MTLEEIASANVLAIVPYFIPHIGGGETHLYQMAELLSAKGHSITILTQGLPGTLTYEERGKIKIRRFGYALTQAGKRQAYAQILAYVQQHQFQNTILYAYLSVGKEYRTKAMCEILAVAREKGIPRVVRIPSSGRVTELSKLHPDGIKELREADCVIALNPRIYKELVSFGVHSHQIQSIPNGVNINLFKPCPKSRMKGVRASVSCVQDTLVFLCPSRFAPKKRIPELLRLWKQIIEAYNVASSCEFWIVGDPRLKTKQGQVSRRIHALAGELKLTGLRLFPAEPHPEMPKYFQASDVYISLSTQEGMSNAMLEAMATCLPVIAPATEATRQLIRDGWNGFLFAPGDLASAEQAILRFLNTDKEQRIKMGQRGREIVRQKYKIEDVAERFSELFNRLISKSI